MQRFSPYYPVTPHIVNRGWGVPDVLYKEFGFDLHNGVDLALVHGQPIYAPFDCRVTKVAVEPNGSGLYVCLLSRARYEFPDGMKARVEITFMHLSNTHVRVGMNLSVGAEIGFGGNTGRSTGPHTHMAPKRVRMTILGTYRDAEQNTAGNTFDPEPYWNKLPAKP